MNPEDENVFATPESFEVYKRRIAARLAARREGRAAFLTRAIQELEKLLDEARLLCERELEEELRGVLEAARRERQCR